MRKVIITLLILLCATFVSAFIDPITNVECSTNQSLYHDWNGSMSITADLIIDVDDILDASNQQFVVYIENLYWTTDDTIYPFIKTQNSGGSYLMATSPKHPLYPNNWLYYNTAEADSGFVANYQTYYNLTFREDLSTNTGNYTWISSDGEVNQTDKTFDVAGSDFQEIKIDWDAGTVSWDYIVVWNCTDGGSGMGGNCECPTDAAPPPATPPPYLIINATDVYNDSSIQTFEAYFTNNGSLINLTTNGTLKTLLNGSLENITVNTTENGGYYQEFFINYITNGTLEVNFSRYFNVYEYGFSEQKEYNGINYTRNLSYGLNYTCPEFYAADLNLYLNGTLNKTISLTCNNDSLFQNDSFIFWEENVYTTGIIFNTSYLPAANRVSTANQTFTADLYNPVTNPLSFNYLDGFNSSNGSLSLVCTDNIFTAPYYNLTFGGVQIYYNNTDSGTNHTEEINMTSGTNTAFGSCADLFGSTNTSLSRTVYLRSIYIIDETNASLFDVTNLTNLKVYFEDNSSSFDFKAQGTAQVNFTSALTNKLRFELEYSNGDIITRYVDVSLGNGDLRVCANTDPTTHYEQLIVSATQRKVSLNNVFAQCTVGEDYTRFVYQDSFILRALTRDSTYYLYSYDSDGDKVYLASLDGSISSYYNIDTLEFNLEGYSLDVTGNSLTFERVTNTSIKIFFKNLKNDSVSTNVTITNQNTSQIYFSVLEEETPNQFYMTFDFTTLGLDEKDVLKIELLTYDADGTETAMIRYFNLSGRTGFLSSPILFVVGLLLTIFGLSMTAARSSLGWFGLMVIVASIGMMAFAIMTWYILIMMAIDVIIGAFIGIILFSNRQQIGVT